MADIEYDGEDDLEQIGNLADVNAKRALVNVEKKKREKLQILSMDLTNEPRGEGNDDASGVFVDLLVGVIGGNNDGYEYKERVYADPRIKKGKKASAFKSVFMPYMKSLVLAIKGKSHEDTFFQGVVRSRETALEDIIQRASALCGQAFIAELGVERGGAMQDEKGNKIPDKFFDDKQRIFGFVPAN